MRSVTIKLEGSTILQDGLIAPSNDGREVFIFPANLGAKQFDVHPDNKMIVISVPSSEFALLTNELINSGKLTLGSAPSPHKDSGVEAHEIDYGIDEPRAGQR